MKILMSIEKKQNLLRGVFALSSICKGEAFAGYITAHRYSSSTSLGLQLTGKQYVAWVLPSDLERQIEVLGAYVGSLEDVLGWNTLLPGFCRFLRQGDAQKLLDGHIGSTTSGMTTVIGFAGICSGACVSPGICLQCLTEDISPAGLPFWRRDFLMRHVRFCARHNTPIYEICQSCTVRSGRFINLSVPQTTCICGGPLSQRRQGKTRGARDIELDMAIGWSKFLDPEFLPYVQEPYLTELIHERAWEQGFVNHIGVKWSRFYDLLSLAAHKNVAASIQLPYTGQVTINALRGVCAPRNPFHALFLLIILFGSWDAVESALQSRHCSRLSSTILPIKFDTPRYPSSTTLARQAYKRAQLAKSLALLPETCRLYQTLQNANPHLTHSQLRYMLPFPHHLAATRERLWSHGVTTIPTRTGHLYEREVDASLTAHIERRRAELLAAEEPIRITRPRLLRGHNTKTDRAYIDAHFPVAAATLQKYIDTPLTWRRRVVSSAIRAGTFSNWPPGESDQIDELSLHELNLLWRRLQRRERT